MGGSIEIRVKGYDQSSADDGEAIGHFHLPAAPDININGLAVVVPASRLIDLLWTLLWILIFAALATYGVRRRQL